MAAGATSSSEHRRLSVDLLGLAIYWYQQPLDAAAADGGGAGGASRKRSLEMSQDVPGGGADSGEAPAKKQRGPLGAVPVGALLATWEAAALQITIKK